MIMATGNWFNSSAVIMVSWHRSGTSVNGCQICKEQKAKYKCPRCLLKTCSLACVKRHKAESECSGVREKTSYMKMSEFTDLSLLNDYRFLEDVGRKADSAVRDRMNKQPRYQRMSKIQNKMTFQSRQRGITLKIMPPRFTKRRENKTRYIASKDEFLWHVQWVFPQSEAKYSELVPEHTKVLDRLEHFIHPSNSDPVIRQKLKLYTKHWPSDLHCFMKVEERKANSVRYHKLDVNQSLVDNLKEKTIVEYPTIHVVTLDKCPEYRVLDSFIQEISDSESSEESSEDGESDEETADKTPQSKDSDVMSKKVSHVAMDNSC